MIQESRIGVDKRIAARVSCLKLLRGCRAFSSAQQKSRRFVPG